MHLADWRRQNGITQQALAEAIGVTQGRVSQLEQPNAAPPSLDLAAKIAAATGGAVSVADFTPATDVRPMQVAEAG